LSEFGLFKTSFVNSAIYTSTTQRTAVLYSVQASYVTARETKWRWFTHWLICNWTIKHWLQSRYRNWITLRYKSSTWTKKL